MMCLTSQALTGSRYPTNPELFSSNQPVPTRKLEMTGYQVIGIQLKKVIWNRCSDLPSLVPSTWKASGQGCIFRLTCSHRELTKDHVLTSVYAKFFRTITRNAVNTSVWRKIDCSWLPSNKHAMNIWLSSLRFQAHLSWRTGKHLHVLHVLRTYSTSSYPGY